MMSADRVGEYPGTQRRPLAAWPIAVAILLASAVMSSPAHAADTFQIATFNMAGGHDKHGLRGHEAPDALAASIAERKPAFVLLQEACADWNDRVVYALNVLREKNNALPGYDREFDAVAKSQGGAEAECEHPSPFGNAIIFRKDFGFGKGTKKAHALTCPANQACGHAKREQREMLCMRAEAKKVVACSIHLSLDAKLQLAEAKQARHILATEYTGYKQFAGGDLNGKPDSATAGQFYDRKYGNGAEGTLKDVGSPCKNAIQSGAFCRRGESTHGDRKIDYVFVSPGVTITSANATKAKYSDHDPLWAGVSF